MVSRYKIAPVSTMIVLSIMVVSLLGTVIDEGSFIIRRIGKFSVYTYKFGVFITEPDSGVYYNVSPYDAYIINDPRSRSIFEEALLESTQSTKAKEARNNYYLFFWDKEKSALQTRATDPLTKRFMTALAYFEQLEPEATFYNNGLKTVVQTKIEGDDTIQFKLLTEQMQLKALGFSMTLNEEDLIADANGNVFSFQTDHPYIKFNNYRHSDSKTSILPESGLTYISSPYITILNRNNTGALKIYTSDPRIKQVYIDNQFRRLSFEFEPGQIPTFSVKVIDNYGEEVISL